MLKSHTFSNSGFGENDSNVPLQIDKNNGCKNILEYIRMNNRNTLFPVISAGPQISAAL